MKKMDKFFNSIASLMSNLLRSCVINSMYDLVDLIEEYSEGNSYQGEYTLFKGLALPTKIHIVHFFMVSDLEYAYVRAFICVYSIQNKKYSIQWNCLHEKNWIVESWCGCHIESFDITGRV